jgi:hypothetical protein
LPPRFGIALFAAILAIRLCHARVLWVEECYPMAAAIQVLGGKLPYLDFFFDKPPLAIAYYLLFGALPGIPLRIAGAILVFASCRILYRFAASLWSPREAKAAAVLLAAALSFDVHASILAVAPDLLLLPLQTAAVYCAHLQRPRLAGLFAGLGLLTNSKAVFAAAACLVFCPSPWIAALFLAPSLPLFLLPQYREQVWVWGGLYARNTFLLAPWREALIRTLNWAGFHSGFLLLSIRGSHLQLWTWFGLMAMSVTLGLRFFPRYYLALLPPLCLLAARGILLLPKRWLIVTFCLLAIPGIRFGPRHALLALDQPWRDLELFEDARLAAREIPPGRSLYVWGYRPEIYVLTRAPLGTRYLESQPITGVFADRHLTQSRNLDPAFTAAHRKALLESWPDVIVDGLGPLNPQLSLAQVMPGWLAQYRETHRTRTTLTYQRITAPSTPESVSREKP